MSESSESKRSKVKYRGATGLVAHYLRSRMGQEVRVEEIEHAVNMPVDVVQKSVAYIRAHGMLDIQPIARGVLWHVVAPSATDERPAPPVLSAVNGASIPAVPSTLAGEDAKDADLRVGALFEIVFHTRAGAVIAQSESGELYKISEI